MKWIVMVLLVLPGVYGWGWDTHEALAESMYYALDDEWKEKLDVELMKNGSITPDRDFKNFRRHSFPSSLVETDTWLTMTRDALEHEDYNGASYAFGIVSHYLSDTFSAPHSVGGEEYKDHRQYENQGKEFYQYVGCVDEVVNVGDVLYTGSLYSETWDDWMESRESVLPQTAVHDAGMYLLMIGGEVFGSDCSSFSTVFEEETFSVGALQLFMVGGVSVVILVVCVSLWRDLKDD